jgi:hypothetical protein
VTTTDDYALGITETTEATQMTSPQTPLASQPDGQLSPNFKFQRPDWVLFRSMDTLGQKAGVSKHRLRRLVIKELVDNALDAGADVRLWQEDNAGRARYFVQDDGPGMGSPEDVARLFSINRPLVSSKLWRLPQRGALGNGLRVVVGAVVASGGQLWVSTKNFRNRVVLRDDGGSDVISEPVAMPIGTVVEIEFGEEMPGDAEALDWGSTAISLANGGPAYAGRTSAHWYGPDSFFELLQAAGQLPVREVIAQLEGCSGAKAGKVAAAYRSTACRALNREQAADLLRTARDWAKPVRPERLGAIGEREGIPGYAALRGIVHMGGKAPAANIPFCIESWARAVSERESTVTFSINRTPTSARFTIFRSKKDFTVRGAGLAYCFDAPSGNYEIHVNVTAPYCPISNDGKEPDLEPFGDEIISAIEKAVFKARRKAPKAGTAEQRTQKAVVIDHLEEIIKKASGNGAYRFQLRQTFYVARPIVMEELGVEITYPNYETIIGDYEAENGEIPGLIRDPRGAIFHPHTGEHIALGTLAVEQYSRPAWSFNKVLYSEKEGLFEALRAAQWPERNDCALVTSKGFSTRAVRDLLDLIGDDGEPVTVFCIHDADAAGGMIFQTLQGETKARPRRRIQIVNLGLEPWEALNMELPVERIAVRGRRSAVAEYVRQRPDGQRWVEWLQSNRIELNAMTTPQFIDWLNSKLAQHDSGKVVPPDLVLRSELSAVVEQQISNLIIEDILHAAGYPDLLAQEMEVFTRSMTQIDVSADTREWLRNSPESNWKAWAEALASAIIKK